MADKVNERTQKQKEDNYDADDDLELEVWVRHFIASGHRTAVFIILLFVFADFIDCGQCVIGIASRF